MLRLDFLGQLTRGLERRACPVGCPWAYDYGKFNACSRGSRGRYGQIQKGVMIHSEANMRNKGAALTNAGPNLVSGMGNN